MSGDERVDDGSQPAVIGDPIAEAALLAVGPLPAQAEWDRLRERVRRFNRDYLEGR
jgi:hypothetical protein